MKHFLMIFLYIYTRYYTNATCPVLCNQNLCTYGILSCSDIGLDSIPEIPPPKTTKIIIKNQKFKNPILIYRNLSKYGPEEINLKSLTIKNCGITEIESESFSHLIHLVEMDLSNNDLRLINPKTFKALTLKSLILDGNRFLKLNGYSFQGLVVNSLSLSNCGLQNLKYDSIKEISGDLIKFNLSFNNLKTISDKFFLLFKRLEDIRLDNNRLKCDCHLKWLNKILKHNKNSIYLSTKCFYPQELRGKLITNLEEFQFNCPKPDLKAISVDISSRSAILYCSSTPFSDTQVSWQLKNSYNTTSFQIKDLIEQPNNASIKVLQQTKSDKFSCVVSNENGNVSVDLNIRWPEDSVTKTNDVNTPILIFTNQKNSSKSVIKNPTNYLFIKQFTFLEMILSIGSTFVVTTITFSLIYLLISRKMNLSIGKQSPSKDGYQGGIYSDTQIYDLPRYSSPQKSYQPSAQLIDFKTQKLIIQDIQ